MLEVLTQEFPELTFIESIKNDDYFFIGKDVEIAKGRSGDQFKRSYLNFINSSEYKPFLFRNKPKFITLEGNRLRSFKKRYEEKYNKSLGAINKLHVINETATFNYLLSDKLDNYPIYQESFPSSLSEHEIVKELVSLSSYTSNPFRREVTILNSLKDQTSKTRRLDLYRELEHCIEVYEVKKTALTSEHISSTLGDKGYLHLLSSSKKPIKFYFLAPFCLSSSSRLLSLIPSIDFISIDELILSLFKEIKDSMPAEGYWYIKRIYEEYKNTFYILQHLIH